MTSTSTSRVSTQQLNADIDTYSALKAISDYQPHNPRYTRQSAGDALDQMRAADEAAIQAQNTLAATRDALLVAQREFHEIILGVKNEAKVIYGPDSDQVSALGLKKKSERAKPKRTTKTPAVG